MVFCSRSIRAALIAVAAIAFFAATPAFALLVGLPIEPNQTYRVLDHPDGSLYPPAYALRLDGLDGNEANDFTFSAETNGAFLTIGYDPAGSGSIEIKGTVYGGHTVGDDYVTAQLWEVDFLYEGIFVDGDALEVTSSSGFGTGTIKPLGDGFGDPVGGFTPGALINLVDKANMSGLSFRLDRGHRMDPGGEHVITGHGWLTHDQRDRTSYQDWLFTVDSQPIPEPGTALLLGLGLAGLAANRRRA